MAFVKEVAQEAGGAFYKLGPVPSEQSDGIEIVQKSLTSKSLQILKLLWHNGKRKTVYSFDKSQTELARELQVTRQALSIHLKRLRELGFVQVGRGVINVTEDGLKAIGYHSNPVIVTVRLSGQKRLQAFGRIKALPTVEIFVVTGDADAVLIVEQDKLDGILGALSEIDGVLETKALVSIGGISHA